MAIQLIGARQLTNNVPGRPPALRKTKSATQAIAVGTATSVVWETTTENTGFTLASTTLFKPEVSGLYRVTCTIGFGQHATPSATRRLVAVFDNTGAANLDPQASTPALTAAGQDTNVIVEGVYLLSSANDYAIRARQDNTTAGNLNVQVSSQLAVEWVGPVF